MKRKSVRACYARSSAGLFGASVILLALAFVHPAIAYTPESPKVRAAIDRAVEALLADRGSDGRLGAQCLAGITLLKAGTPPEHARIQRIAEECRNASENPEFLNDLLIYSHGLAIIFLCELNAYSEPDAQTSQLEIEALLAGLIKRQKPHGGWGYEGKSTGDTSMTQYAVLATWSAKQAGIATSNESTAKVLNWLIRTQDPVGVWGYQGYDPGEGNPRVRQTERRLSIHCAGAGSVYIAADVLGLTRRTRSAVRTDLPSGLKLVRQKDTTAARKPLTRLVNRTALRRAMSDANGYYQRSFKIQLPTWTYYYLYALERYMSFREIAEGRPVTSPNWYDAGAEYLMETQRKDGTWKGEAGTTSDTAFGALFLMRGTLMQIKKAGIDFGAGRLTGGRGLPNSTGELQLTNGQILVRPIERELDDIINQLENSDSAVQSYSGAPLPAQLSGDPAERAKQVVRLEKVLRRGKADSRLVAVRLLSADRDLNNAPRLITALRDKDPRVVVNARNGLRRMSRKVNGFGLSSEPTPDDVARVVKQWNQWYRTIHPDADILD